jgi:hypothetical protein
VWLWGIFPSFLPLSLRFNHLCLVALHQALCFRFIPTRDKHAHVGWPIICFCRAVQLKVKGRWLSGHLTRFKWMKESYHLFRIK